MTMLNSHENDVIELIVLSPVHQTNTNSSGNNINETVVRAL